MIVSVNKREVLMDDDIDLSVLTNNLTITSAGYAASRIGSEKVLIHHLVLPKRKDSFVDHINRNKLDNRRSNLRYASGTLNSLNSGLYSHSTTGVRGVSKLKDRKVGGWRSYINVKGRQIRLGRFICPLMAALARSRYQANLLINLK